MEELLILEKLLCYIIDFSDYGILFNYNCYGVSLIVECLFTE